MVEAFQGIIQLTLFALDQLIIVLVVSVVVLMVLRWVLLQMSPFGWATYYVRRVTDPMVWPIAQRLPDGMGIAPLLVVLIVLLGGYFCKEVIREVLGALLGLLGAIADGDPIAMLGWLLYGAVSLFLMLLIIRIVMSWIPFARDGRLMWNLYRLTEPVMAPFRQLIPPLGMFDLPLYTRPSLASVNL